MRAGGAIAMAWLLPVACSVPASARAPSQGLLASAWHPRALFHLRPGVDDVAFDGARVALVTRAPGARLDLRDLSGRLIGHAALPGGERLGLLAFGGTSAVVDQITLVGNSEIGGRWVVARPGAPFRVVRRYHSTHEGAGGACCAVAVGSGAAAQGTLVAYALLGVAYRVAGSRSIAIAHGVTHVWAVNARRILVQRNDRRLAVLSPAGKTLRVLAAASDPAAVTAGAALQGDRAVVVRRSPAPGGGQSSVLDAYRLSTGARTATWPLGENATGEVTLSGTIAAALQVGRRPTLLLDVAAGRHTTAPVTSPIGHIRLLPAGLVYGGGDGHNGLLVRMLPTAQLQAALAAAPA
jgi:hypothetical protein